ncbi:hypothetical protein CH286_05930 [Rhodococcus sp. WWJCD1]|uniref:hypothetical protein n=1 Tax=Rhodococcus sp. WWJCD1 TaxID=2022519 RepID=UPI000B9A96CA|nr:hypothetical protein [Rhodococcus sp. WWJCD1]OZC51068.1 hypothetical protein CH286_05930 [Rhodococcus sp. WWJCD1]
MVMSRWIGAALGLTLAVALSLLWQFAAPLSAFDATALPGETGSVTIVGYSIAFVERGPHWLAPSLIISAVTLCASATAAEARNRLGHNDTDASNFRCTWWPLPTSVLLAITVWTVATVDPPASAGVDMVHPDSIAAQMSRSPLFRDSSTVFLIECLTISIAIGAVFTAGQRAADGCRRS